MTRAFAFKLFFLSEIVLAFFVIGAVASAVMVSSSLWSLLLIPAVLVILLLIHRAGCREIESAKFLYEAYAYSPALAFVEKFYFWSWSCSLMLNIIAVLMFCPIFVDVPVLLLLSDVKQFELAERTHSLNHSFCNANGHSAAYIHNSVKNKSLNDCDSNKQENAIIKVHGDASIQHGLWLRYRGNDSKNSIIARRSSLLKAVECFGKLNDESSSLLSELNLAQFEAEQKNFDTARQILCQSKSKIELVSKKLSLEEEVSMLETLAAVHHELGNLDLEKGVKRRIEQKEKELLQSYLLGFGYLPIYERLVTTTVIIIGAIATIFNLIFGIVLELTFWRRKQILKFSKYPNEIEAALNFLIPVALCKRKLNLAEEYSRKLLEISEAKSQ